VTAADDDDIERFVIAIDSGDVPTVQRVVDERPARGSSPLGGSLGARTGSPAMHRARPWMRLIAWGLARRT